MQEDEPQMSQNRARSSTCFCRVSYRQGGADRWVVIQRGEGVSTLYCKRCRCEWRSRRKYAADLPEWKKQTRGTVTDDEILHRLFILRDLRIDRETSIVESRAKGKGWIELATFADSHDSGYRFVKINFQGRQRKVAVHVLQWMAATGESVPDDHDVDHITSPPRPQKKDNSLANLRVVPSRFNQSRQPDQMELPF